MIKITAANSRRSLFTVRDGTKIIGFIESKPNDKFTRFTTVHSAVVRYVAPSYVTFTGDIVKDFLGADSLEKAKQFAMEHPEELINKKH